MAPSKRLMYTEEAVQAAVNAVKEKKLSFREASKEYGVPKSTIQNRIRGVPSIRTQSRTVIPHNKELQLVNWLTESARRGFGRTRTQLTSAVETVMSADPGHKTPFKDNRPGKKWFALFRKRHKDTISVRTPQALGSQRASVTKEKITNWFRQAEQDIGQIDHNVLKCPERIFNCDESGFQLGGGVTKVLAPKKDKKIYQISSDTRRQITVLACGSASGDVQPPLMIFPGQRFYFNPTEGFPEAHFAKSGNGWIDSEIFEKWFKTAFIPAVEHLQKPVVLFADGHKTHLSLPIHHLCKDNGIILYHLPSHASHIIQPLDLTVFKNLKQAWREEVMAYQEENSDTLTKRDFAKVLKKAWDKGIKKDIVISGFRAAGICPWNPEHVDFSKTSSSQLFSAPSSSSVLDISVSSVLGPSSVPCSSSSVHEELVTDENAIIPLSPRFSPPPSPPSPLPHVSESTSTANRPASPAQLIPPSPSVSFSFPQSTTTSRSYLSHTKSLTPLRSLDRLLDIAAKFGSDGLVRMRSLHDLERQSDDPEEQQFCELYHHLTDILSDKTGQEEHKQQKQPTFDSLPLPSKWGRQKRKVIEPPKMISSDEFREYFESMEKNKKDQAEEKERKKKEREEKRKKTQEEKERKKEERERKKQEKQQAASASKIKKQKKSFKKREKETKADTDNASMTSSQLIDDNSDVEFSCDENVCHGCSGAMDGVYVDWIECGACCKWYHVKCTNDERLVGMSNEEIGKLMYVRDLCSGKC